MAPAYTSKAIDEMIEDVSETLRREQKNLRKMKRLLTALRGDSSFAPCGVLHTEFDDLLLNGRWLGSRSNSHSMHGPGTHTGSWKNSTGSAENLVEAIDTAEVGQAAALVNNDTSMTDLDNEVQLNGVGEAVNGVLAESVTRSIDVDDGSSGDQESGGPVKPTDPTDAEASLETNTLEAQLEEATNGGPAANHDDADSPHDGEDEDSTSQPTNHRMTTRAQANKVSEQSSPTIASPHLNEEEIPPIHPLFLFPQGANPDADFGLPKKEAEDARALLSLYVAKQEEIVRSFEELRYGLLKANRQRSTVLKWAKAEGHVGEMSDGEDWYDMEEWGLKDPLKKGEEEPEEEANTVGKKTRQRRAER